MLMDAAKISEIIRMKKKKMLEAEPEMIGTSPVPDMNAQDVYDMEQKGRIEESIDAPHKINSDDAQMDMEYDGVGLSPEEKKRMGRLRMYFDSMDLDG
jgi:hypothetical protein